ncbi:HAD family hydrolase [Flavisphingomonas formosensis]|uniref:HAD family hydrolase n=1 Tax=Flavisphingomonas formosensis TaxID=861534 RepID=UPI0012F9EDFC|nr:HAD-IB family phosphatase [Sphingomonas formosensis]
MIELAIYDMDRTITRRATYGPFLAYALRRRAPWRILFLPAVLCVSLAYALKLIDRARLKEINQTLLLGRHISPAHLAPLVAGFAEHTERTNIHPGALSMIAQDKAAGRRLVLATASYKLYAAEIGRRLGFDDIIATNSLIGLDARVSAKIDGENCYGPAKLRMILAWMAAEGLKRDQVHVRFYSDHASDAPAFEWSDDAFAVNAHAELRSLARTQGWPILDWR